MLDKLSLMGSGPKVITDRLILRPPRISDWEKWSGVRAESRDFLVPWEPVWTMDSLTKASFRARLRRYTRDAKDDTGQAFFLIDRKTEDIIGGITLGNIRRGVAQTGTLGYWTGQRHARKGYMFEASSFVKQPHNIPVSNPAGGGIFRIKTARLPTFDFS